ncbi:MAG: cob(I)yrinic acid a,c-diamide adenosyltransferase [Clostridiales bacterium]|nr:cob(I)yrinic acid a,c-diamide adenosyltransferase [Clostridiales bacterium]
MNTGKIEIICGSGKGKTSMAFGRALQALTSHRDVIMIQFLKGSQRMENQEIIKRLEPEMKVFRFEKSDSYFEDLSEEDKKEELFNIHNALNYARKVLTTGECELLVLDEVLGLVDQKIITAAELTQILECRDEADVILTGQVLPEGIARVADRIVTVESQSN